MNTSAAAVSAAQAVSDLVADARVRRAFRLFEERAAEIDAEHVRICEVPAPPFGEEERAKFLAEKFRHCGLADAGLDEEGNCVALRAGRSLRPLLVVSAHLDTVFPAGTDLTVRRDGAKMRAPGVGDDGCGLAALVATLRALEDCP